MFISTKDSTDIKDNIPNAEKNEITEIDVSESDQIVYDKVVTQNRFNNMVKQAKKMFKMFFLR